MQTARHKPARFNIANTDFKPRTWRTLSTTMNATSTNSTAESYQEHYPTPSKRRGNLPRQFQDSSAHVLCNMTHTQSVRLAWGLS